MTKDEALKLALEALEGIHPGNMTPMAEEYWNKAITAIKQALAAPVQEPFCFVYVENGEEYFAPKGAYVPDNAQPLYTTPPAAPDLQAELDATNRQVEILSDVLAESRRQRQWVSLTDEEMQALWDRYAHMEMMRAIEAKLKEKNT